MLKVLGRGCHRCGSGYSSGDLSHIVLLLGLRLGLLKARVGRVGGFPCTLISIVFLGWDDAELTISKSFTPRRTDALTSELDFAILSLEEFLAALWSSSI